MKIHKDIIQRSKEWFELRTGKMTASQAGVIITNGKGLENYVVGLMANKYSKSDIKNEPFTNIDIERGIALEGDARKKYEEVNGVKVDEVGFIEMDEYVGCSPDGLVGDMGGIEIKCPNDTNYFKILLGGIEEVDKTYIAQIQMNLYITARKWWDYVAYNPNFDTDIIIFRIYPDAKMFAKIKQGVDNGIKMINHIESKLKEDKDLIGFNNNNI